mgnify:FL=1
MQIKLENIGIVKDSTIALDGLTVITGKNNSGKTTVGKTLYALLDSVCNLQQKAKSDRRYYIKMQLENVASALELFRYIRIRKSELQLALFSDYPALKKILGRDYLRGVFPDDIEKYAHELANELEKFDVSILEKINNDQGLLPYSRQFLLLTEKNNDTSIVNVFNTQRNNALVILEQLFANLDKDAELVDYARESINQTLQVEFSNQIQPISTNVPYSKIELSDGDSIFFDVKVINNNVVNNEYPVFYSSPYRKVYLIDDPFIIDDAPTYGMYRGSEIVETETIFNPNRIYPHNNKLKAVLRKRTELSIFEQTVLADSLKVVKAQIDQVIPGTFEFTSDGEYYIQNGVKLKVSNLATGSKMFSIVKMLLEKGELDSGTMLILDEPEAHLHPQWQNTFAEIIVLLVKELNVNILLTTHSPNFMLALDAYMRKYEIAEKTNFYQTSAMENGFVQYHCLNNDIGKIYQDFLQYLSEAKMLRNKYLTYAEE